ncbi:MAG: MBL fold metallo-hydrolase [Kiritimatiellae bacterium]|nr:MBL fold metallo-hydrolase [Kiritimatiellia bacterium]
MGLKLSVLASGSSGNCTYIASETTHLLIDAGLSGKKTIKLLEQVDGNAEHINAICLTHEHSDHRSGLGVLQRKFGLQLFGNAGTIEAVEMDKKLVGLDWSIFSAGQSFSIGDLVVEPFSVPHDSYDPVGFVVCCADIRVGVVTDMGVATAAIRDRLKGCSALVVESNHDEDMLRDADRPWMLKQRIAGRQGHLSNTQAGELVVDVAGPELKSVFLAHLSGDCNTPELALDSMRSVLDGNNLGHIDVYMTFADKASVMLEL